MFCSKCGIQIPENSTFCPQCGQAVENTHGKSIEMGGVIRKGQEYGALRIIKIVVSVLSMVLFVLIVFQSCVVGIGNTFMSNREVSGTAGVFLALAMLVAGIIGICVRNSESNAGRYTTGIIYGIGGLIGTVNAGSYTDLEIWANISFVFAVLFFLPVKRKLLR